MSTLQTKLGTRRSHRNDQKAGKLTRGGHVYGLGASEEKAVEWRPPSPVTIQGFHRQNLVGARTSPRGEQAPGEGRRGSEPQAGSRRVSRRGRVSQVWPVSGLQAGPCPGAASPPSTPSAPGPAVPRELRWHQEEEEGHVFICSRHTLALSNYWAPGLRRALRRQDPEGLGRSRRVKSVPPETWERRASLARDEAVEETGRAKLTQSRRGELAAGGARRCVLLARRRSVIRVSSRRLQNRQVLTEGWLADPR